MSAHPLCQRTQAGHTNRWQLAGALGSDLLGQAQVRRAEEFGGKSADRKIKSGEMCNTPKNAMQENCVGLMHT